MQPLTRNGTDGRVYGGDCNLVHIADHTRRDFGRDVAMFVEREMRHRDPTLRHMSAAEIDLAGHPGAYRFAPDGGTVVNWSKPLCPGCYMIAIFNAAIALAEANGQSIQELCHTMAEAFTRLCELDNVAGGYEERSIEEIHVFLDGDAA